MTDPQQSCPRCHLYLSARGCTPERCANPEGAAEVERMRAKEATAQRQEIPFVDKLREGERWITNLHGQIIGKARDISAVTAPKPPSDLDTFRAMLERAGVRFEEEKGPFVGSPGIGTPSVAVKVAAGFETVKLHFMADGRGGLMAITVSRE